MRGRHEEQEVMLAYVNLEERVPKDHPLRTIKAVVDEALKRLSPEFDRMYSKVGRASVPPERLLKASLLISLYSVRSERAFCETGRHLRGSFARSMVNVGRRGAHHHTPSLARRYLRQKLVFQFLAVRGKRQAPTLPSRSRSISRMKA